MSDYASRRISEAELSVMETLWDNGSPMTAKDLQVLLKERRGWERTTVRSLLTRLQEKGSVQVDKDADVATYAPNFTRGAGGPALRQRRPDPGHHFDSAWDAEKGRFGRTVIK